MTDDDERAKREAAFHQGVKAMARLALNYPYSQLEETLLAEIRSVTLLGHSSLRYRDIDDPDHDERH
jgi:hypothetical protein